VGGRERRRRWRRKRAAERRRRRWVVERVVMGVFAVAFGIITVVMTFDVIALRGETDEAEATVLEVSHGWRGISTMDVEFVTADGELIESSTPYFDADPAPEVGDRIRILYATDNPFAVAQVGSRPDFFLPIAFGVIVLFAAAVAVDLFLPWIPAWLRDP
jgi:hypothetical protein